LVFQSTETSATVIFWSSIVDLNSSWFASAICLKCSQSESGRRLWVYMGSVDKFQVIAS